MADATTWAEPGGVRSTTTGSFTATSTNHSDSTRRKMILGRDALAWQLRKRVRGLAAPHANLDRAHVFEVARHRRLRGDDARLGEQVDELRLARDGAAFEQGRNAVLTLLFGEPHDETSISHHRMPRAAARRFAACSNTALCGPSITSASTSSPRIAGKQCRKIASDRPRRTRRSSR